LNNSIDLIDHLAKVSGVADYSASVYIVCRVAARPIVSFGNWREVHIAGSNPDGNNFYNRTKDS
jgi:hypothetical protein